jgi:dihydrofolate reductase
MRKIVVTEFLSLDGVMENPAWTFPYWNDEVLAFKTEEKDTSDALLLGRVTYEGFAASWPKMSPEKDPFAPYMNSVRKYVVSTTLDKVGWNNSVLLKGDLVEEVNKLKQEDGGDIAVHGSATLAQTLMQHDLVDSLRLLVYPVVVGKGKPLFKEGNPLKKWKLVETKATSLGVVFLAYEPDRSS